MFGLGRRLLDVLSMLGSCVENSTGQNVYQVNHLAAQTAEIRLL